MLPGTPPMGCHCRDRDLSLCAAVWGEHSLQQWPGTLTALSTGPAVHLPEHHTLNLFHQTRCSSGGVQCLLAESQDFLPSVALLYLCCLKNILSGTAGTNNWHPEAGECQWHSGQRAAWEHQSPRLCSWLWVLHQLKQSRSVFTSQIFSLHPVFYSRKHWICTELAQWDHSPWQHSNKRCFTATNCQRRLKFKFLHLSRCLSFLHK